MQIQVGDKVAYSVQWLRSVGLSHSEEARARGIVTALVPLGNIELAEVDWQGADCPNKVNVKNLAKVGPNTRFAAC